MCARCNKFQELSDRAEAIRDGVGDLDTMDRVEADLEALFEQITREDGPLNERDVEWNEGVRGRILRGEKPGPQVFAGTPDQMFEMLSKILNTTPDKPEEPKMPTVEETLEAAAMDVEKAMILVEPAINLAVRLRERLEAANFSSAVAEQMAAQVFLATMKGGQS